MAVVTWTGDPGSSEQAKEVKGYKFRKDQGVSINDEDVLKELEGDKTFRIEGGGPGAASSQAVPGTLPEYARKKQEADLGGDKPPE